MKNKERTKTNRIFRKTLFSALVGITFISSTAEAADYDISTDFSPISNPSGPWSYGAKTNLAEGFAPYEIRGTTSLSGVPIEYWQMVASQEPTIYRNGTTSTASSGNTLNIPAGTVWMYGGTGSSPFAYGTIRFTCPPGGDGIYLVETSVAPVYDGQPQGDTDYHVVKNGAELFGQYLTPTEITGYTNMVGLSNGDVLDFMIGRGADNNNYGSGLKTRIRIRKEMPPATGLVVNGGFEFGDEPGSSIDVSASNSNAIYGWTVDSGSVDYIGSRWVAAEGGRCLDLSGTGPGTISQTISGLNVGARYRLSFSMAANPEVAAFTARLQASIANVVEEFTFSPGGGGVTNLGWEEKSTEFVAESPSHRLSFESLNPGWAGAAVDNVSIELIALPAPLVTNGSFEEGVEPGISADIQGPNSTDITGWTVETASVDYIGSRWVAGDGLRCLDLSGTGAATISQEISGLVPGVNYRLSFLMAANPEVATYTARLIAAIGSTSNEFVFEQTGISTTNLSWEERSMNFVPDADTLVLSFSSLNPGIAGPALDRVVIEQFEIPPPPSGLVFDLSEGVSGSSNPNGPWSCGWASTVGGDTVLLNGPYPGAFDGGVSVPYWATNPSQFPAVYKNNSSNAVTAGGAVYAPGTVWFIPGANGRPENFGVIRFKVPAGAAGTYVLGAHVAPAYTGGPQGDSDFHISKNGVELFGRFLSPVEQASYTNELTLEDGDTLDFSIGRGADGNLFGSILRIAASLSATTNALAPLVIVQPQSQQLIRGDNATLNVVAGGTPALRYQWRKDEVDLEGATNSALNLPAITFADAGAYTVVITNDLGAVTSAVANVVVTLGPSRLRVVSVATTAEGQVDLPVEMVANGNENAVGFSLTFNPTLLQFIDASPSPTLPKASLIFNTNELHNGRLGIALALPAALVFPEGAQEIVRINLEAVSATQSSVASVGFGDQPVLRQVSDVAASTLPAVYSGGTVTIEVAGLEADVAPRPDGNNTVTIIDWVQLGRYVAALDTITNSLEFQKADSAPRSTRGNGAVTVSDWVQAGRYAAGLDPLRPAGGPAEPVAALTAAGATPAGAGRFLTIPATNALPRTTLVLPVWFDASGDENALAFTLSFDAANLQFIGAEKAGKMSTATLNVNNNLNGAGKLGIAMALPIGTAMSAGRDSILLLYFAVSPTASGVGAFSFGDSPVFREVADVSANSLPTTFTAAGVTFGPPREVGPPLTAARSGNSILLFWPSSALDFEVYSSSNPESTGWVKVPGTPVSIGGQWFMTAPLGDGNQFFRLEKR